jgi:hypothetical protein
MNPCCRSQAASRRASLAPLARRHRVSLLAALAIAAQSSVAYGQPADPPIADFFSAASLDAARAEPAQERIAEAWRDGYTAMIVDLLDLLQRTALVSPQAWARVSRLAAFLEQETGQAFGTDLDRWRQWIWSLPYEPHSAYGSFKGQLYAQLDPRFAEFFLPPVETSIRLDEIQWGGVAVNGIPPLDHPAHLAASEARYLDDDNIVFGIFIDGEARAYPKRILAWHELALDRLGGRDLTIVYCTLCGTVIPFDSRVGDRVRTFGTSGLLYQSNKLMFDAETHSLWSSLTGTPVVGPLVGSGLRLGPLPVVTTTWAEWRRAHPDTTVLSLDTGFTRDYSEGAAYRDYFATDALMFDVSEHDDRLLNKAEVLALRLPRQAGEPARPLAISADYLLEHPVYHIDATEPPLVVVTSPSGANRVYESGAYRFERLSADGHVLDSDGRTWTVSENMLQASFDATLRLPRVAAHRAFWFGWYAQHPDTLLID